MISESAGESSDTNSQADFFDDSEKRQQALTNRRQQFITEARRFVLNLENFVPALQITSQKTHQCKCLGRDYILQSLFLIFSFWYEVKPFKC